MSSAADRAQKLAALKAGAKGGAAAAAATADKSKNGTTGTQVEEAQSYTAKYTGTWPLPPRSRWSVDLPCSTTVPHAQAMSTLVQSLANGDNNNNNPPGFLAGDFVQDKDTVSGDKASKDAQKQADLIYSSAMNLATAPGRQLFMTGFMLWMSGNSLQIFSIMMLLMAFWTPLTKLFEVNKEFERYENNKNVEGGKVNLLLPKLVFVLMNLAGLGVALYKAQTMGLLPTSAADWLSTAVRPSPQISAGAVI